jgi:hypothetical protein
MQHQVISYKTALLAKEKGFNEESSDWYDEEQNTHHHLVTSARNAGLTGKKCVAVSQDLLQKWLRITHKILVEVFPVDSWNEWHYRIVTEDCMAPFAIVECAGDDGEWKDHDVAREIGLHEALKYINS